jgi:hypothetical protein
VAAETYHANGNLKSETVDGGVMYTYHSNGVCASADYPHGHYHTWRKDGTRKSTVYNGRAGSDTWRRDGTLKSTTDANGATANYRRDGSLRCYHAATAAQSCKRCVKKPR